MAKASLCVEALLILICDRKQHGDADVEAAAKTVLRDWAHNLFPYYTLPTKSEIEKSKAEISESDRKALDLLKPRQELKKVGKGLIRLKVPEVDERVVSGILRD